MRIYRGNIGVDLSLDEFSILLEDNERIDDLLNLIYDLEMDEVMAYNHEDMKEFEQALLKEAADYQRNQYASEDVIRMERIVQHLAKYGR